MKFFNLNRAWIFLSLLVAIVLISLVRSPLKVPEAAIPESQKLSEIPGLLLISFLRMLVAYLMSLVFGFAMGTLAATDTKRSKVLLPLLDALQSIPVLGFFPTVIFWFVGSTGSRWGLEFSAVFLIFTCMCWNLAFCVYESIKAIPFETMEAGRSLGLGTMARFRQIYVPAAFPRVVDNSVLSWSNGWFFLMACEIIALGSMSFTLPGIGSFLAVTIEKQDWLHLVMGIGSLVFLILAMDFFLWKPLQEYTKNFSFESSTKEGSRSKTAFALVNFYRNSSYFLLPRKLFEGVIQFWKFLESIFERPTNQGFKETPSMKVLRPLGTTLFWTSILFIVGTAAFKVFRSLTMKWEESALSILGAVLVSGLRILVAYAFCMLLIGPIVYAFHRKPRALERMRSLSQILGSIPATAFFPWLIFITLTVFGADEFVVLLLLATGMIWYLMFNILGGASKIPGDFIEASDSLGLKGWLYLKKVFIPCLLPATITGSITAVGGGWNTLIVAEYFKYTGEVHRVYGVGALIAKATYELADDLLLTRSMLFMVVFILILNHFVWQRLYNWAEQKFRLEG